MLQVDNRTPFPARLAVLPDPDGVDTVYAAIRGTFTLEPQPRIADEQLPVAVEPVHLGDPATTSAVQPADVGLARPGCDVLVHGDAVAPGGRPVTAVDVAVEVGPVRQSARVFGDRWWHRQGTGYVRSEPVPFERIPLVWERAFGGRTTVAGGERAEPRNPIGTGWRHPDAIEWPDVIAAANIEDPADPVTALGQRGTPIGFLPIGPHWEPRRRWAGTYDEAWQRERCPYLPADFDPRFLHDAPPPLVHPSPFTGGERIRLWGMTEAGFLEAAVPVVALDVAMRIDGRDEPCATAIECVWLDPTAHRLTVRWRAAFRADKRALRVRACRIRLRGAE